MRDLVEAIPREGKHEQQRFRTGARDDAVALRAFAGNLDEAVAVAYGWSADISDDEVLREWLAA